MRFLKWILPAFFIFSALWALDVPANLPLWRIVTGGVMLGLLWCNDDLFRIYEPTRALKEDRDAE